MLFGLAYQVDSKRAWNPHQEITLVMSLTAIKYTIKTDGNLEEEVKGADDHACQRITNLIEN